MHVFGDSDLRGNLFSVHTACDADCTVTFNKTSIRITSADGTTLLEGRRTTKHGMWMINLDEETRRANNAATEPAVDEKDNVPERPATDEKSDAREPPAQLVASPEKPTLLSSPPTHPTYTDDYQSKHYKKHLARLTTKGGPRTIAQLIRWHHASFGSPTLETFATAVDNGWINIPGLTAEHIRAYLQSLPATAKGHLDQHRQGIDSTKVDNSPAATTSSADVPTNPTGARRRIFSHIFATHDVQTGLHSDQTGKFPVQSSAGHNYMMVFVDELNGYIHNELLKSRTAKDITEGYRAATKFYAAQGFKPAYARLDNETSAELDAFFTSENIEAQYVEPGCHRALRAERAIRTWKNHFAAIIATTDKAFPLNQWHELVPQAELTLNLLRGSTIAPKISAWQMMFGKPYNFSAHPIAPFGMKIIVHEKPTERGSHSFHGADAFYLGPESKHYRAYRVYVPSTGGTRVSATVQWLPPIDFILPGASAYEALASDIEQLRLTLSTMPATDIGRQPAAALQHSLTALHQHTTSIIEGQQTDDPTARTTTADQEATSGNPAADQRVIQTTSPDHAIEGEPSKNVTFAEGTKGAAGEQRVQETAPEERVLTTANFTGKPPRRPKRVITKVAADKVAEAQAEAAAVQRRIDERSAREKAAADKITADEAARDEAIEKRRRQTADDKAAAILKVSRQRTAKKTATARKAAEAEEERKAINGAMKLAKKETTARRVADDEAEAQEIISVFKHAARNNADPAIRRSARSRKASRYANAAMRNVDRKRRYHANAVVSVLNAMAADIDAATLPNLKNAAPQMLQEAYMIELEQKLCKWCESLKQMNANAATVDTIDTDPVELIISALRAAMPPEYVANAARVAPLTFRSAMTGENKSEWAEALATEYRKLLKGGKNSVMHAIRRADKRAGAICSYFNPQVKEKEKEDGIKRRVRGTFGGDKSNYEGNVTAWVANINVVKLLINKAISQKGCKKFCMDITDYYLGTPMEPEMYEYLSIPSADIPRTIRDEFNLDQLTEGNSITFEVTKGMYGLPVAGRLAQERLKAHLATHGYIEKPNTPCLFHHKERDTYFTLVVDDFFAVCTSDDNKNHLISAINEQYDTTIDHAASKYLGLNLDWHHSNTSVRVSMPNRIKQACERFGIEAPTKPVDGPAAYAQPVYGKGVQQMSHVDSSALLDAADVTFVKEVIGTLTHYARMVDPTMRRDVSRLASMQANPTQDVMKDVIRLMQYAASHPDAGIEYTASDMRLQSHSDASFHCESNARSRAGGIHFLTTNANRNNPAAINGAIEVISTIIPSVVGSAAEAEFASLYLNGMTAECLRNTLADLGYPQGPTQIFVDNQCAVGLANDQLKQKRSKAFDLRYYWTKDRVKQGHLEIVWAPGITNLADYFTKAFTAQHHRDVRKIYVTNSAKVSTETTTFTRQRVCYNGRKARGRAP